ncbi:MAG: hypothetical protein RL693_1036 [Verrucomicrobiota bacterium]|jgi:hypothetical protein
MTGTMRPAVANGCTAYRTDGDAATGVTELVADDGTTGSTPGRTTYCGRWGRCVTTGKTCRDGDGSQEQCQGFELESMFHGMAMVGVKRVREITVSKSTLQ